MLDRVVCKVEIDPLDGRSLKITALDPYEASPLIVEEPEEVTPHPYFLDNSVYEFKIPGLKAKNGSPNDIHAKYITSPTPALVSLRDVTSLANGLQLDDESILYHIREASKYAMYLVDKYNDLNPAEPMNVNKYNIQSQHFTVYMFIKYKALRDCLLDFYIKEAAKPKKIKNQAGDLIYEHEYDLSAIKELLDDIEDEYEKWEEEIVTITASPKAVTRGKYSYTKVYPTRLGSSGYGRDRYPVGIDIHAGLYSRRR